MTIFDTDRLPAAQLRELFSGEFYMDEIHLTNHLAGTMQYSEALLCQLTLT